MKKPVFILFLLLCALSSCNLMHNLLARKEKPGGCPVGRNVGAEKILAGDAKSIKIARKAEKAANKAKY